MNKARKILRDHKREGKKLIPPFLQIGNLSENSYVDLIIPEIIWMAILNQKLGLEKGTDISLKVVQAAEKLEKNTSYRYSFISSFECLSKGEQQQIVTELKEGGTLEILKDCLRNFLTIHQSCPLGFILEQDEFIIESDLSEIKTILSLLFNKVGREATFSLGNVIYHLGACGKLNVEVGSPLSQLPKLVDYPRTVLSKMIASGVRASVHAMFHEPFHNSKNQWNKTFWNTGIVLEPCLI